MNRRINFQLSDEQLVEIEQAINSSVHPGEQAKTGAKAVPSGGMADHGFVI